MLTANYLPAGYCFYSRGRFKDEAQAQRAELDIIARYDLAISKHVRHDRKERGLANVQLLRYRLFYVILATEGEHRFFRREGDIRDARDVPIYFESYTVSQRRGHSCVRLSP